MTKQRHVTRPTQERIIALNEGRTEARNLMETLAVDFPTLLKNTFPDIILPPLPEQGGITKKMSLLGQAFYEQKGMQCLEKLIHHPSDTLRGCVPYVISFHSLPFQEKLHRVRPLADDAHSGVREWAWLALRNDVIHNLDEALDTLMPWVTDNSERIRRFSSEITRPRGVWCAHIRALRQTPWKALSLIEQLNNDDARYVQLSVGNWLNDAGKDHPDWVKDICVDWRGASKTLSTEKICKRGLRNLK